MPPAPKVNSAIVPGSGTAVGVPELPPEDVLPLEVEVLPDEVLPDEELVAGGLGLGFHQVASAGAASAIEAAAAAASR